MIAKRRLQFAAVLLLALLLGGSLATSAASSSLEMHAYVIGGGGGGGETGGLRLNATAGQAVAGTTLGGSYDLCSGFWCAAGTKGLYPIYLPLLLRGS